MIILAIETSSEACSCAVQIGDGPPVERFELAPRRHTERLLPMVQDLLAACGLVLGQVDAFAYGRGPGSFTGVRVAACAVQGLALAVERPVIPVSSLAALAARAGAPGEQVLAALDARMGEVYLGIYRMRPDGLPGPRGEEQLASPDALSLPEEGAWTGAGPGFRAHGPALRRRLGARLVRCRDDVLPGAAEVARLASAQDAARAPTEAVPEYPRRRVTTPRRRPPVPGQDLRKTTQYTDSHEK